MACGALSGLKLLVFSTHPIQLLGLNGLWSPFGFETEDDKAFFLKNFLG